MLEWAAVMPVPSLLRLALASLMVVFALPSCGSGAESEPEGDEPVLVGAVTREEIEEAVPGWVEGTASAEIDPEAAAALAEVPPGAEVTVFLGTWCSDSRREVPRFWRALDHARDRSPDPVEGPGDGGLPFTVDYVAVDRDKEEPAELLVGRDLAYVPTFVVRRDGREVGRIVESAPGGVEADLLALLRWEMWGVISGRDDV